MDLGQLFIFYLQEFLEFHLFLLYGSNLRSFQRGLQQKKKSKILTKIKSIRLI